MQKGLPEILNFIFLLIAYQICIELSIKKQFKIDLCNSQSSLTDDRYEYLLFFTSLILVPLYEIL